MTMRAPSHGHPRGFTLLEVLVALMIFTFAAVVLGSAYVNVLNGYDLAQKANARHEGLEFARSQLLVTADHDQAEQGASFDDADGGHVRWHAQIDPTPTVDVFSVTFICEIEDPVKHVPETITENFMILRPTWSEPTARTKLLADVKTRIAKIQGITPK
jgi:prepilin-type N-terminal cleavage/methylation domain-containing protein